MKEYKYIVVDVQLGTTLYRTNDYESGCRVAFGYQDLNDHNDEWVTLVDTAHGRAISQVLG
jgi:hypothetical protein